MARTYVNADAVLAQSAERMATRPKCMVLKCQGYEIEIGRSGSPTRNEIVYFVWQTVLVNSVPRTWMAKNLTSKSKPNNTDNLMSHLNFCLNVSSCVFLFSNLGSFEGGVSGSKSSVSLLLLFTKISIISFSEEE